MPVTRLDTSHLNSLSLMHLFVCFYMFLSMNLLAVCFMASICFGLSWCFTRFPDVFMIALPMSRTFGLFFSSFARAPFFGLCLFTSTIVVFGRIMSRVLRIIFGVFSFVFEFFRKKQPIEVFCEKRCS